MKYRHALLAAALLLLAAPSAVFADTAPAQCPAVEEADADTATAEEANAAPVDGALFLTDEEPGGGDPQCDHVSGCGFVPKRPFIKSDEGCAAKCPGVCGYETGYWDESSGCCICVFAF